jgi:hypothetical protein
MIEVLYAHTRAIWYILPMLFPFSLLNISRKKCILCWPLTAHALRTKKDHTTPRWVPRWWSPRPYRRPTHVPSPSNSDSNNDCRPRPPLWHHSPATRDRDGSPTAACHPSTSFYRGDGHRPDNPPTPIHPTT